MEGLAGMRGRELRASTASDLPAEIAGILQGRTHSPHHVFSQP